jgi:endonuclease III
MVGASAIRSVLRRLRRQQGPFQPKPGLPVLDELVATILSQHTPDRNSERAFSTLRERFPAWEDVLASPTVAVADAIRSGGMADQKTARIQLVLATVREREGRLDLARLRDLPDAEAEAYLTSLPGVGPKTAACVLTFSMGRAAFPVDTHVHRVTARLGWVPAGATAERVHALLRDAVPPPIRYELHMALIVHGRTVCSARRPACSVCVLRERCAFALAHRERRDALNVLR